MGKSWTWQKGQCYKISQQLVGPLYWISLGIAEPGLSMNDMLIYPTKSRLYTHTCIYIYMYVFILCNKYVCIYINIYIYMRCGAVRICGSENLVSFCNILHGLLHFDHLDDHWETSFSMNVKIFRWTMNQRLALEGVMFEVNSAKSTAMTGSWLTIMTPVPRLIGSHCSRNITWNEPRKKKNSYFLLYWMVNRDPYNGLL